LVAVLVTIAERERVFQSLIGKLQLFLRPDARLLKGGLAIFRGIGLQLSHHLFLRL
jgi:hypothetical protein